MLQETVAADFGSHDTSNITADNNSGEMDTITLLPNESR
jgi:hypothetical protein